MPKGKSKKGHGRKGGKPDPVEYQFSVIPTGKGVPKGMKISGDLLREVITQRILTGRAPRGFRVTRVRWRNPMTKNPDPAPGTTVSADGWRESTVSEAIATLRLKEAVRRGSLRISPFRTGKRIR